MTLHLYLDAALTLPVSEGDLSRPDADDYNGTDGESKDRQLWIANEWAALASALTESQTQISLGAARFADGQVVIVGAEQMLILSGGGSASLTVQRGYGSTTRAPHAAGAPVYSGYDYSGLAIEVVDADGTSEAGWIALALAQGGLASATPGAQLLVGAKAHDQALSFWRRCSVPAGTPVQIKRDLKLRLSGAELPIY